MKLADRFPSPRSLSGLALLLAMSLPSVAGATAPSLAQQATPTTLAPNLPKNLSVNPQVCEKAAAPGVLRMQSPGLASHPATEAAVAPPKVIVPTTTAVPPPMGRVRTVLHAIGRVALQAGGIAVGLGEKVLGKAAPNVTGVFKPIEVTAPPGDPRSVVVFRSNQPKTPEDIGTVVDLARERGVTKPSQIMFVNLRSEKDEDPALVQQYQAGAGADPGGGQIKTLDVKIIDNAPPAFYLGALGWGRAVEQVKTVYVALKDPSIKVAVIHCEQGEGRTGEIVATAVRIAMDGMSPEQAVAEAEQHGLKMPWQHAFVERFAREWQAGKINFNE